MNTKTVINNSNWTVTKICAILCLLSCVGIFLPSLLGMDCFSGGCGIGAMMLFFAIMFAVSAFVYGALAKRQDQILKDQHPLASWQMSAREWEEFTREEYARDKQEKKLLFFMVAGWSLFFGILFPIIDNENGYFVSIVMAGLILVAGGAALLSVLLARRGNVRSNGKILITEYGAFLGNRMHAWGMAGGMIIGASKGKDYIEISYKGGKTDYSVRIPISEGKETEAQDVVLKLQKIINNSQPGFLQRVG